MGDKDGIDGFFTKAMDPCSLLFFCYNSSKARASSVAMETNVQSQLWFCLGKPIRLERSWHSSQSCFSFWLRLLGLTMSKISSLCLTAMSDMGQITVANHSKPFVLPLLKCFIWDFFFSNISQVGHTHAHTHTRTHKQADKTMFAI